MFVKLAAVVAMGVGAVAPNWAAAKAAPTARPAKQIVRSQDDLPRHGYAVPSTAVELLNADDSTFAAWAAPIANDITGTLAKYDIRDHAARRLLLANRLSYQVLTHRDRAALTTIAEMRALEDKPDARLMSGARLEAIVKARIATGSSSGPAFEEAFASKYQAALDRMPWPVVGVRIKQDKSRSQILGPSYVQGWVAKTIEPIVSRDHRISDGPAGDLMWARLTRNVEGPLIRMTVATLGRVVAANRVARPDIWAARDVTLTAADRLTPVVVGVWDSGTDVSLFPGQTYVDPQPQAKLPYNEHGLSFDVDRMPSAGWLYPLTTEQQAEYKIAIEDFQGRSDLEQSIDSPAADALKVKLAAMPSAEVPIYLERLNFYGGYMHGTHVAGIIARGNPAVRLAVARMTFDYRNVAAPPTDALMQREAASFHMYVDWFRTHGVRVVNMSWSGTPAGYEDDLEKNGIGKDAAERKALARHYFEIERTALLESLKSAPEILFVCAAGNSNGDNSFEEAIPSGFDLPNLLAVGAVDQAGEEASFTSYGRNVIVDANGYEVDSLIPGGGHLRESGTSMASPNVANLAAKLIALDPRLIPDETIRLIRAGATASSDGRRHNVDPKSSISLLRQHSPS